MGKEIAPKRLPHGGRPPGPSYASIIWIRFMGLLRSRAALSAFVPAPAGTGWLPGDSQTLGPR
jgi:hypothetical protein